MKKLFALIISVLLLCGQSIFSESVKEEMDKYKDVSVFIKYQNKTMYYPGTPDTNPVNVHISLKNNSTKTLRFKLADDRMFSLDFFVRTIKNTQLENTENIIKKRTTNQTVYFREIALEPGEEYSFVENLKDYIVIDEPSIYYLDMKFYPELYKSRVISMNSNHLTLEIVPSPSAASASILPVKNKTAEILKPEEIAPDKVVEQTINARQKSLWNQYFLYMDVESMLLRNAATKRKYVAANAEERSKMLDNFKADLKLSRIESEIVAIPEKYEIEKTTYTRTEGTVTVVEWFKYPKFYEKKRYVYKVRQREGIWQIYDYTVTNLGTE